MLENGTSSFFHYDALGSTHQLTDSSQTVTDTYRYNGWGETVARTGTTKNRHTYVGRERYYGVPDAMLYLLGLRYLSVGLGRFLTADPLTRLLAAVVAEALSSGPASTYMYAHSAPSLRTDPQGLWDKYRVHFERTREWARQIEAWGKRGRWRFRATVNEAWRMGFASENVDVTYDPHGVLWSPDRYAPWHFDWPQGSGSRERLAADHLKRAIALGQNRSNCLLAADTLGTGLHPIQDKWAHGDASPLEHVWVPNWRYIDDEDYDTDWRARGFVAIDVLRGLSGPLAQLPLARLQALNYGSPAVLTYWFANVGAARSCRMRATRFETQSRIREWLVKTCCGEPAP